MDLLHRRNLEAMRRSAQTKEARQIRGLRLDRRLTQRQLAELVGLSESTVSRAERGRFSAKTIRKIREELNEREVTRADA